MFLLCLARGLEGGTADSLLLTWFETGSGETCLFRWFSCRKGDFPFFAKSTRYTALCKKTLSGTVRNYSLVLVAVCSWGTDRQEELSVVSCINIFNSRFQFCAQSCGKPLYM